MQFRNRSSILIAALSCVAAAGARFSQSLGLTSPIALEPPHQGRQHHSKAVKPNRRHRLKAQRERLKRARRAVSSVNRAMWICSARDGAEEKARMISNQKGKHGPWMWDGRMERRGKGVAL